MFLGILAILLTSFITILCFGLYIGTYGSAIIATSNLFIALITSIVLFNSYNDLVTVISLGDLIRLTNYSFIELEFQYDNLTGVMFVVITSISALVHLYSTVYMFSDPFLSRFMAYLTLFTFSMLVLVSSSNFIVLFIGWEGVGLCSYLLISFWYTRYQAAKSATKAFIVNKIGDVFLLTSICLLVACYGTTDFVTLNVLVHFTNVGEIELIALFMFLGVVGKSAQIGLHTWLPDAMEGPTPVSALLHAATMVTAGVFLLIRAAFIFEQAPQLLILIAKWGGITALLSGLIGAVQEDIKKIIAYSTCSQLGYMVLICGLSHYNLALFHLFNHAFFKALLFLAAGSIIHFMSNEQDIRRMGGLGIIVPVGYIVILIGSLALTSFPFTAGSYSKDIIIELAGTEYWINSTFVYWLALSAALLTTFYSVKLLYSVFLAPFKGTKSSLIAAHRPTVVEYCILTTLAICSLVTGYYFRDLFIGWGSDFLLIASSATTVPSSSDINAELVSGISKTIPLVGSVVSTYIFVVMQRIKRSYYNYHLTSFEICKLFYNEVINRYISLSVLIYGRHAFEQYERIAIKGFGPDVFIRKIKSLIYKGKIK